MRLESLTVRDIGPIKTEFRLNLAEVPGTIIGIHGENAVGKSTFLESYAAAISPKMKTPSRDRLLKDLAVSRSAMVEVSVVNGCAYTIQHRFDSVSGKTESSVTGADGQPVLKSTLVSQFKPWAAKHMPDPDVIVASLFGAQRQAKLVEATDGERKAIILRALGFERYERLAKSAREYARKLSGELSSVVARLDELGVVDVAAAELAVETSIAGAKTADEALAAARKQLEQAQALVTEAERVTERRRVQLARRKELSERIEKAELDVVAADAQLGRARSEVSDIDTRIANNRKAIAEREQIEDAVRRRGQIDSELTEIGEQLRALKVEAESLRKEQARLEREAESTSRRVAQQKQRLPRLRQDLERSREAEGAAAKLRGLRDELESSRKELEQLGSDLAELEVQRESARTTRSESESREERAKADAAACRERAEKARERANKILQDVQRAQEGADACEHLPAREAELKAAKDEYSAAEQELARLRGERLSGAEERIDGLRGALTEIGESDAAPGGDPTNRLAAAARLARHTIRTDDEVVDRAATLPKDIQEAEERLSSATEVVESAAVQVAECRQLAALAPRLEEDREALAEAEAEAERELRAAADFDHAAEVEEQTQQFMRGDFAGLSRKIEDAQERVAVARGQVEARERAVASCAELAALAARLESDQEALAELEAQIAGDETAATELLAKAEECKAGLVRCSDRRGDLERNKEGLDEERERVEPTAAKAPRLASAEERIEQLTTQREGAATRVQEAEERLESARGTQRELEETLAAEPKPEPVPEAPTAKEVEQLTESVTERDRESKKAHAAVSVAEKALADTRVSADRAATLTSESKQLESELSDWTLLARDLGRDGLQADEIDCAGPELTSVVNDLLHSCLGTRYTLRFETTRMDAKGRRELEGLPIIMTDTVNGYEGDVRNGSGGEFSLLGDVISLAVGVTSVLQAGIERPTLIRDEPGAALSAENRRVYMEMLRKAAELIKADKVLIVTHDDEMLAMADSKIEVTREGLRIH